MIMNIKMTNGILFIAGALAPFIIYMGLGPDGAGLFDTAAAERWVFWIMLSIPIAFMMTADTMKGGSGQVYAKAGLIIMIIGFAGGSVGDAIGAQEEFKNLGSAVQSTFWTAMLIGVGVTGIGYFVQKTFPSWLCGLMMLAGVYAFIMFGILDMSDEDAIAMPGWIAMMLSFLCLGILTIKNQNSKK
jgi:Zn-dependent protease with chaperone function